MCFRVTILLSFLMLANTSMMSAQFDNFVTVQGDKLMDGDNRLRFISLNVPNLHYLEDNFPFGSTNPWRLPDEFEIRDALSTIKQMGGKVTRMYVLSVRRQDDLPETIRHVEGPGKFNEEAFRTLDKVLQIANETGVRLIIPFVDNWKWWGGPEEYAAFRNKPKEAFWTDPEIIADIKTTIGFLINRKNTYTGTLYKDDRAILAWETGNELHSPFSWTREIAAYIKSQDRNHLVLEGIHATEVSQDAIDDPNLDILSTHHYHNPRVSLEAITKNCQTLKGKKPYIVGEYGIVPTQDIRAITDTIIHQGAAGGMVWSLRFRNRDGGFYFHHEYGGVSAYHWPGFRVGNDYDERAVLSLLHEKAYEIDGAIVPRLPVPEPPVLLTTNDVAAISWRGSVGARTYVVERRDADSSDWSAVAAGVDESRYQYRPLFSDESASIGRSYLYRVRAANESGLSEYSNIIGPVVVAARTLVDELDSFDRVFQKDGELTLLTHQDIREAGEDRSRLTGTDGSYIMYRIPGDAWTIRIDVVCPDEQSNVSVAVDSALGAFRPIAPVTRRHKYGANDYGYFDTVSYTSDRLPAGTHFVKILLEDGAQICRVEITYGSRSGL
jgi:mannan endo-1,4-beta-mannosidase